MPRPKKGAINAGLIMDYARKHCDRLGNVNRDEMLKDFHQRFHLTPDQTMIAIQHLEKEHVIETVEYIKKSNNTPQIEIQPGSRYAFFKRTYVYFDIPHKKKV